MSDARHQAEYKTFVDDTETSRLVRIRGNVRHRHQAVIQSLAF